MLTQIHRQEQVLVWNKKMDNDWKEIIRGNYVKPSA